MKHDIWFEIKTRRNDETDRNTPLCLTPDIGPTRWQAWLKLITRPAPVMGTPQDMLELLRLLGSEFVLRSMPAYWCAEILFVSSADLLGKVRPCLYSNAQTVPEALHGLLLLIHRRTAYRETTTWREKKAIAPRAVSNTSSQPKEIPSV